MAEAGQPAGWSAANARRRSRGRPARTRSSIKASALPASHAGDRQTEVGAQMVGVGVHHLAESSGSFEAVAPIEIGVAEVDEQPACRVQA